MSTGSILKIAALGASMFLVSTVSGQIIGQPLSPGVPAIAQVGGTTGFVPMEHGPCPGVVDCATHVLATQGNLDMQFRAQMTCPAGETVAFMAAHPAGQRATVLAQNTSQSSYDARITLRPYTRQEIERTCASALGGAWPLPGRHNNDEPRVTTTISKRVYVIGRCSGSQRSVTRSTVALTTLTCEDRDFVIPPG